MTEQDGQLWSQQYLVSFEGKKPWVCTHYQSFKGLKPVTSRMHTYFTTEACAVNSSITFFSYIASVFVNGTIKIILQQSNQY